MTTIALPWAAPTLTKNTVRRLHHHAEAKARKTIVDVVALLARDIDPHARRRHRPALGHAMRHNRSQRA